MSHTQRKSESSGSSTVTGKNSTTVSSKSSTTTPLVLVNTPIADIKPGVEHLHKAFHEKHKTHLLQFRLNQLRNVYFVVKDNVESICDALQKDFNRAPSETKMLEVATGLSEIVHTMSHLHKWAQPEKLTGRTLALLASPGYVEKVPLGVILIISPFNYPLMLSLGAIAGAIAAGNAVVFKPSELTPHFSQLFSILLSKALDPDIFFVVNGGIPETTAVLDQKFDKIMYTGNLMVAKIIAKKAAETLTPTILELGGKSPGIVLDDVKDKDLDVIAQRILWGRFTNAGQTCVAIDYLLVPEKLHEKMVKALVRAHQETFYKDLTKDDKEHTHIIHERAFNAMKRLLDTTKGNIIVGGQTDAATHYVAPTIIDNVNWDDLTMEGEIFGPILPIITYKDLLTTIREVVKRHDTPLLQSVFTSAGTSRKSNPQIDQILLTLRSGAAIVNDSVLHVGLPNAPFGGVGTSGQGAYHGIWSFRAFSHERIILELDFMTEFALKVRYPPYNENKTRVIENTFAPHGGKLWFGRQGDVNVGGPNLVWSVWAGFTGLLNLIHSFTKV